MMHDLYIDKNEVLRYLGYKGQILDENTKDLIEKCVDEIKTLIKERYIYKFFEIQKFDEKTILKDCTLELSGKDIAAHLKYSDICVLLAVTLGSAVDTKIRYYEKSNMTRALILDACATTAVEEICDRVCRIIEEKVKTQGKILTSRFSPGYGDLPLGVQGDFISVLEANKAIGLTASAHNILIPRKSVTAIIGVINEEDKSEGKTCLNCGKYSDCEFRRRNGSCGA